MFIFEKIPDLSFQNDFCESIASKTRPFMAKRYRTTGLYSKFGKNTVTVVNAEENFSPPGETADIMFYGIFIPWFSKRLLLGWIGTSFTLTAFLFSTMMSPFEYEHIRVIALIFWCIVYFGEKKRIRQLERLVSEALGDRTDDSLS